MGIRVSFVVIAYNEAGNIGRTLDRITALVGLAERRYEVIVVNDGSRDRTADIVADRAARNPRINLIDLPENRGRGYARATGIGRRRVNSSRLSTRTSSFPATGSSGPRRRSQVTMRSAVPRSLTGMSRTCFRQPGSCPGLSATPLR